MVVHTRCLSFLKIVIICGLNAFPKEINRGFLNSIYGLSEQHVKHVSQQLYKNTRGSVLKLTKLHSHVKLQAESKASEENAVSL